MRAVDRERLRPLALAERPPGQRLLGRRVDDLLLVEARDPHRGRVPEPDDAVAVDEEDAVADELERLRRLRAAAQLSDQAGVVERRGCAAGELTDELEVVVRVPARPDAHRA